MRESILLRLENAKQIKQPDIAIELQEIYIKTYRYIGELRSSLDSAKEGLTSRSKKDVRNLLALFGISHDCYGRK